MKKIFFLLLILPLFGLAQTTEEDSDGLFLNNGKLTYERICGVPGKSKSAIHAAIKRFAVDSAVGKVIFPVDDTAAGNLSFNGETSMSVYTTRMHGVIAYFNVHAFTADRETTIIMQDFTGVEASRGGIGSRARPVDFNALYAQSRGFEGSLQKSYVTAFEYKLRNSILLYADKLCRYINEQENGE